MGMEADGYEFVWHQSLLVELTCEKHVLGPER